MSWLAEEKEKKTGITLKKNGGIDYHLGGTRARQYLEKKEKKNGKKVVDNQVGKGSRKGSSLKYCKTSGKLVLEPFRRWAQKEPNTLVARSRTKGSENQIRPSTLKRPNHQDASSRGWGKR